ncbi:hypothetical protein [Schleiferilactobacillus harbinensis]
MASCFTEKNLTKEKILNGIAAWDFDRVFNTFNQQLFGIDPKKVETNESANEKH